MPDDGSGNFSRLYDWTTDEGNAINILASRMDAEDDGIATALTNRVCKDGQSTMSGNLKMGTNKVTGLGSATAATDAAAYSQVVSGAATYYGLTGGTSTAFTITPSPAITAYTTGAKIEFQPHTDCGAAPTMAISGIASPLGMRKFDHAGTAIALIAGDVQDDQFYTGYSNGTYFIVDNPSYPYVIPQTLALGATTTLTIATGSVTTTKSNHLIDTESAAATDDLDTIVAGTAGQVLSLSPVSAARKIVIKHNTGNIFNPRGKDIVLGATTDKCKLEYDTTASKWIVINPGMLLQYAYSLLTTQTFGSGNIPKDGTIPQSSEGNEFTTLAFTPQSSSSYLKITIEATLAGTDLGYCAALFKDSDANAILVAAEESSSGSRHANLKAVLIVASGSTTARTYKLRYGTASGDCYINSRADITNLYGGVLYSGITIEEFS